MTAKKSNRRVTSTDIRDIVSNRLKMEVAQSEQIEESLRRYQMMYDQVNAAQ